MLLNPAGRESNQLVEKGQAKVCTRVPNSLMRATQMDDSGRLSLMDKINERGVDEMFLPTMKEVLQMLLLLP
jgi:hypothetical protein